MLRPQHSRVKRSATLLSPKIFLFLLPLHLAILACQGRGVIQMANGQGIMWLEWILVGAVELPWVDTDMDITLHKETTDLPESRLSGMRRPDPRDHLDARRSALRNSVRRLFPAWSTHGYLVHGWVLIFDVHTHYHSLQQDLATCTRHASHSFTRPPRKQTMSEDTWTLVRTKRRWRRNLAACQQLQRKTFLQAFLLTWRQTCFKTAVVDDSLSCRTEFDIILKQLDVDIATALHQFRSHGRQVTQALRHDDARF